MRKQFPARIGKHTTILFNPHTLDRSARVILANIAHNKCALTDLGEMGTEHLMQALEELTRLENGETPTVTFPTINGVAQFTFENTHGGYPVMEVRTRYELMMFAMTSARVSELHHAIEQTLAECRK